MTIKNLSERIASRTSDAYSFSNYNNWTACARVLLDIGYNEAQTEAILRSKFTRWAADAANARHGRATSRQLRTYVQTNSGAVAKMLAEEVGRG